MWIVSIANIWGKNIIQNNLIKNMSKIYKGEDVKNNILLGMEVLVSCHSHRVPSGRYAIRGIITSISFKNNAFKVSDRACFTFDAEDLIVEVLSKDEMTNKITYDVLNPEKTWNNLKVGEIIIEPETGKEKIVLGICGEMIFYGSLNCLDHDSMRKEALMAYCWKIKGASEDKPSIDDVIAKLEDLVTCSSRERRLISEAIEMLKKLK